MLCKLQQATQRIGPKINYNKTKMMTNLSNEEIIIEDTAIEIIEKYLEMRISRNKQTAELLRRTIGSIQKTMRYI